MEKGKELLCDPRGQILGSIVVKKPTAEYQVLLATFCGKACVCVWKGCKNLYVARFYEDTPDANTRQPGCVGETGQRGKRHEGDIWLWIFGCYLNFEPYRMYYLSYI